MTSAMKMAALAAAVLLILAGSAIHDHQGAARTASPAVPKMPPRQSVEMVAPAATITSTVHYQAGAPSSSCTATTCTLPFPKPGSKRQVNITRMNCVFFASAGSTFSHGEIQFYDAARHIYLARNPAGRFVQLHRGSLDQQRRRFADHRRSTHRGLFGARQRCADSTRLHGERNLEHPGISLPVTAARCS